MRTSSATVLTALVLSASLAAAAPSLVSPKQGTSIPLRRRSPKLRTTAEIQAHARREADALIAKYSKPSQDRKRAGIASEPLTDLNTDFTYYGTVEVGTPANSYQVILDTGSSEFWLASSTCTLGCEGLNNTFDATASSTFTTNNAPIDIHYGKGAASGTLANDTVSMQGFTVQGQGFSVMNNISASPLPARSPVTGLMGLAWTSLTISGAVPFWLAAINAGEWASPLFAFYLARYSDDADAVRSEANGGRMDLGFTNTSLYTGDIAYVDLVSEEYWLIPLQEIDINGTTLGVQGSAAIDTGTSLIGCPSAALPQIYAQIPNAQPAPPADNLAGYYVFPCAEAPAVSLTFGGKSYSIEPTDFARTVDDTGVQCYGSFFPLDIGGAVTWVVGDTFLKNVYSVYRATPPSVGFAPLKAISTSTSTTASGGPTSAVLPSSGGNGPTSSASSTASSTASSATTNQTTGAAERVVSLGSFGGVVGVVGALLGAVMGGVFVL